MAEWSKPQDLATSAKINIRLAEALLRGADKSELHQILGALSDKPLSASALDTARMNLVGGLRAIGFQVTGGRGGGKVYQVVGWEQPQASVEGGIETWDKMSLRLLKTIISQPSLELGDKSWIDFYLGHKVDEHLHESSFGYLWSYELARDKAFVIPWKGQKVVAIRKFENKPRWRIFDVMNSYEHLRQVAEILSSISYRPVTIINLSEGKARAFKENEDPNAEIVLRREAMIDIPDFCSHWEEHFSKKQRKSIRQAWRDTEYRQVAGPRTMSYLMIEPWDDMLSVFNQWKELNLHKHRQPALTRDVVAISALIYPYKTIAYRDGVPVQFTICDVLPADEGNTATLLVEKGLNYSHFPDGTVVQGGKSGTTDAAMIKLLMDLQSNGIRWMNMGGYEGGGDGLPDHKHRYADPKNDVFSATVKTSFPCYGEGSDED